MLCLLLSITPIIGHVEIMGYSVKANIPENQIDKNKTYFDLKLALTKNKIVV